MKPVNNQLEVLFLTGTTFAKNEFESNHAENNKVFSREDMLENAFWNGLLFELLPELKPENSLKEKTFLWAINNYHSSLWLNLCNEPFMADSTTSVDPHQFIKSFIIN